MDLVADIKARLNIEDLVSGYVQLKKVGRNFKGLCPFHQEKTPSFHVNPEKQLAYCFGCHQGGDVFQFLQLIEGVDFPEALKMLSERVGLDPSEYRTSFKKIPSKSEKQPFFDAHKKAEEFYADRLWNTEEGKKVLEYLQHRGLTEKTIRDFRLGFAPDEHDVLAKFLLGEKFDRTVLLQSGLILVKDVQGERISDRFRMRLMFPIRNAQGFTVAFGGRALKKGMEPKYLNSPETPLYHKSDILYGFSEAKNTLRERGVLLVEGYMDALACHQAGFSHTVATSGTALTFSQVTLLRRFTDQFFFCFDNDHAGWEASKRGFLEALSQDVFVRMVEIPDGKDPAEALQKDRAGFENALKNARPFLDVFFDRLFGQFPKMTPDSVTKILKEVIPVLQHIGNRVVLDLTVRDFAKRLGVREASVYDELQRAKKPAASSTASAVGVEKTDISLFLKKLTPEQTLLSIVLYFPEKLIFLKEHLLLDQLSSSARPVFELLFEKDVPELLAAAHEHRLSDADCQLVHFLSFYGETVYAQLRPQELEKLIKISVDKLALHTKNARMEHLKEALRKAEKEKDAENSRNLLAELRDLMKNT